MSEREPIRVVIADDQAIVRSGLSAFVMAYDQLRLIGEAENGEEAVQLCELTQPDVILMDLKMPGMDGITATRAIRQRWPHIQVLVLTSFREKEMVQGALDAGATGYLLKDITAKELVAAIIKIHTGGEMIAQEVTQEAASADGMTKVLDAALDRSGQQSQHLASQELAMAGRIQAGILPEKPPVLRGWDFSAKLVPARETSGDFFDFIPLANGKWGILVADVTDKGLGAAVFMALSSSLIRTYAMRYPTLPALAVSSVNERILSDTRGSLFVTAFYGVLEPDVGRMRYVNAGHNPPLLVSAQKGKPVDRLRGTGMALGVSEEATWQQKIVKFAPGDTLVMYTDGITEAQSHQGAFFGESRLLDVVRSNVGRPAYQIQEAVLAEVGNFTGDSSKQDDIALIVLNRKR